MRRLLLCAFLLGVNGRAQVIAVDHGPNAPEQQGKHFLVLVSLDGFRWDYARKYGAANLLAMAAHGASAPEGMLPSYPSLTVPNQYTLVTGLYPEHHGIVANSFEEGGRRYSYDDPASSADGSWYGGMPLWVLAEQQGMRAACFSWTGSEAAIAGGRPSFYARYDDKDPDAARVDQVLAWLKLPEAQRPHLVTLSLASVDRAGREFGPDAPRTRAAVRQVDATVGRLRAGLVALKLPVDLVVVSDHGMASTESGWVDLEKYTGLTGFKTEGSLLYAPSETEAQKAYEQLKIADARFKVYRRADVPRELHYNGSMREGDPVVVPTAAAAIRAHGAGTGGAPQAGSDGYDALLVPEMKAVFYAEGPDVRAGVKLKPFENVNVYPFVTEILGLNAPKTDGSAGVLSPALAR